MAFAAVCVGIPYCHPVFPNVIPAQAGIHFIVIPAQAGIHWLSIRRRAVAGFKVVPGLCQDDDNAM